MADSRTISTVIVTYNGRRFIEDCLRTVNDDLSECTSEIIVVDNNSTDGTREFIEENHPDIHLIINHDNYGFARAMNQGIEVAQYEFLWLLNQDIRVGNGTVRGLLRCYDELVTNKKNRPGVIGPQLVGFDGNHQKYCRRFPRYHHLFFELTGLSRLFSRSRLFNGWKMGDFDHLSSRAVEQPMGSAMLLHRSCITEVGGFDESFPIFFNDVDLCRRLVEAGYTNYFCTEAVVAHYHGGAVRQRRPSMIWRSHSSMARYFFKWEKRCYGLLLRLLRLPLPVVAWLALMVSAIPRSLYHLLRKST